MEIHCPNCGAENWLENQSRCLRCNAVLRRCVDCANYDAGKQTCTNLGTDVHEHQVHRVPLSQIGTAGRLCPDPRRR